MSTKLYAVADADERPIRLFITAGQAIGCTGAAALLGSLPEAEWLLAARSYDADWLQRCIGRQGDIALHFKSKVAWQARQT